MFIMHDFLLHESCWFLCAQEAPHIPLCLQNPVIVGLFALFQIKYLAINNNEALTCSRSDPRDARPHLMNAGCHI